MKLHLRFLFRIVPAALVACTAVIFTIESPEMPRVWERNAEAPNIAFAHTTCCEEEQIDDTPHYFGVSECTKTPFYTNCAEPTKGGSEFDNCANELSLWCVPCGNGCQYQFRYNDDVVGQCDYATNAENVFIYYYSSPTGTCFHSTKTFTHDKDHSGDNNLDEGTKYKYDWGIYTYSCISNGPRIYKPLESSTEPDDEEESGDPSGSEEADCGE